MTATITNIELGRRCKPNKFTLTIINIPIEIDTISKSKSRRETQDNFIQKNIRILEGYSRI